MDYVVVAILFLVLGCGIGVTLVLFHQHMNNPNKETQQALLKHKLMSSDNPQVYASWRDEIQKTEFS